MARPTSAARADGSAAARAIAAGPWLEPMTKSRSPLTWKRQPSLRTSRKAVRSRRPSLSAPSTSTATSTSTSGWGP